MDNFPPTPSQSPLSLHAMIHKAMGQVKLLKRFLGDLSCNFPVHCLALVPGGGSLYSVVDGSVSYLVASSSYEYC